MSVGFHLVEGWDVGIDPQKVNAISLFVTHIPGVCFLKGLSYAFGLSRVQMHIPPTR